MENWKWLGYNIQRYNRDVLHIKERIKKGKNIEWERYGYNK